ncbi:MAG: DMT family transporter [Acidobacteria bacterium]|nr:DMT family transporter [Acidobacteriota bacterium]
MAAYLSAGVNTLLFSTAVAVLGWRASGGNTSLRPEALIWFVSAGFFGPFLARLLNYSSIRSVGASRTSPLVAVSPVFTALLAVAFLNEEADLRLWLGTVLIVVGTMIVAPAYRERPR